MYFTQQKCIGNTIRTFIKCCENTNDIIHREFYKFPNLPMFRLTACRPAVTPTSTRFFKNRLSRPIYETVVPMKIHLLHYGVSFHPPQHLPFLSVSFKKNERRC